MKVLVAYDGTLHSQTALQYGMGKVRENGGELVVLHVFNSHLFLGYDSIPGAVDTARRESGRFVDEAARILRENGKGIKACIVVEEGNPEREIIRCARDENVDLLLCPTRYKAVAKTFRKILNEKGIETSIYAYESNPHAIAHTSR
jgi:nucleotide-binding universal stress UspA family protein